MSAIHVPVKEEADVSQGLHLINRSKVLREEPERGSPSSEVEVDDPASYECVTLPTRTLSVCVVMKIVQDQGLMRCNP